LGATGVSHRQRDLLVEPWADVREHEDLSIDLQEARAHLGHVVGRGRGVVVEQTEVLWIWVLERRVDLARVQISRLKAVC
jgi:hypothetical protein